jgi:hypothetical protein
MLACTRSIDMDIRIIMLNTNSLVLWADVPEKTATTTTTVEIVKANMVIIAITKEEAIIRISTTTTTTIRMAHIKDKDMTTTNLVTSNLEITIIVIVVDIMIVDIVIVDVVGVVAATTTTITIVTEDHIPETQTEVAIISSNSNMLVELVDTIKVSKLSNNSLLSNSILLSNMVTKVTLLNSCLNNSNQA